MEAAQKRARSQWPLVVEQALVDGYDAWTRPHRVAVLNSGPMEEAVTQLKALVESLGLDQRASSAISDAADEVGAASLLASERAYRQGYRDGAEGEGPISEAVPEEFWPLRMTNGEP